MFKEIWNSLNPYIGIIIGAVIGWRISKAQRVAERRDKAKITMLGHLSILDFFLDDPSNEAAVRLWQSEFPEFLKSMAQQIPSLQTTVSDLLGLALRDLIVDKKSLEEAKKACRGISEQIRRELGFYQYKDYRRYKKWITEEVDKLGVDVHD